MPDPLSIITGVAAVVANTAKGLQTAAKYIQQYKLAELKFRALATECEAVHFALLRMQHLLVHSGSTSSAGVAAHLQEQTGPAKATFDLVLGHVSVAFGILNEQLQVLITPSRNAHDRMASKSKIAAVWNESQIDQLHNLVRGQAQSVQLLLSAFQMESVLKMNEMLSSSEALRILEKAESDAQSFRSSHPSGHLDDRSSSPGAVSSTGAVVAGGRDDDDRDDTQQSAGAAASLGQADTGEPQEGGSAGATGETSPGRRRVESWEPQSVRIMQELLDKHRASEQQRIPVPIQADTYGDSIQHIRQQDLAEAEAFLKTPRLPASMAFKRLSRDMITFVREASNPAEKFYSLRIVDEKSRWFIRATIEGPPSSPYRGGIFHIVISVDENFPSSKPRSHFATRIYHPNISRNGAICMDVLMDQWSPVINMQQLLVSVSSLLSDPGVEDPLIPEIAATYIESREEYNRIAAEMTRKYATLEQDLPQYGIRSQAS